MDDHFEDDYPVDPLTDDDIEARAEGWRSALGLGDADPVPDVLALLRQAGAENLKLTQGLEIIPKPDAEMGDKEAYAIAGPPRIFVRQSALDSAAHNQPRGRMTMMHEFGHLVLHPSKMPKARLATGKLAPRFPIKPYCSAERQTRRYAAAFLMPRTMVRRCATPAELAIRANVSKQAAEIRWLEVGPRPAKEPLPFVIEYLAAAKEGVSKRRTGWNSYTEAEVQALWDQQGNIPAENADMFRKCGRWRIARDQYQMRSECGWYVKDGQVRAHIEESDY